MRADNEQPNEEEDPEETELEEERDYGYDEAQTANTAHGISDVGFACGKPAIRNQRSRHNPRRFGPRISRAYRRSRFRNSRRKWAKAYKVAREGRPRLPQV